MKGTTGKIHPIVPESSLVLASILCAPGRLGLLVHATDQPGGDTQPLSIFLSWIHKYMLIHVSTVDRFMHSHSFAAHISINCTVHTSTNTNVRAHAHTLIHMLICTYMHTYMCIHMHAHTVASISPEAMMHFPSVSDFPTYFWKFFRLLGKFPNLTFSQQNFSVFICISSLFSAKQYISPLFRQNYYSPPTFWNFPLIS